MLDFNCSPDVSSGEHDNIENGVAKYLKEARQESIFSKTDGASSGLVFVPWYF